MKLAAWNVNSLKVRLPQLVDWAARQLPDAVCLQETKLENANFPAQSLRDIGFHAAYAGQKTYNGVAILSREPLTDVIAGVPGFEDDQKRVIAATLRDMRIVCVYVPNGQSVDSDKYQYKLRWLEAATRWLGDELGRHEKLAVLGDFNIAPDERDVHDPKAWEGQVLFSEPERAAFRRLLDLGLTDAFRLFDQPEKSFTWWDYRMNAFRRKMGLRIDHILLSEPLAKQCKSVVIDIEQRKAERPSDHAPVIAEL
ncbi:MAG TPA: exodeoxyribonuclease III [Burkholderiales bacterium]|nr:exodeoxyribonuclease III [Burkholderiales bacterium]